MTSTRQSFHFSRVRKKLKDDFAWKNEWYKRIPTGSSDNGTTQNVQCLRGWLIIPLTVDVAQARVKQPSESV